MKSHTLDQVATKPLRCSQPAPCHAFWQPYPQIPKEKMIEMHINLESKKSFHFPKTSKRHCKRKNSPGIKATYPFYIVFRGFWKIALLCDWDRIQCLHQSIVVHLCCVASLVLPPNPSRRDAGAGCISDSVKRIRILWPKSRANLEKNWGFNFIK